MVLQALQTCLGLLSPDGILISTKEPQRLQNFIFYTLLTIQTLLSLIVESVDKGHVSHDEILF